MKFQAPDWPTNKRRASARRIGELLGSIPGGDATLAQWRSSPRSAAHERSIPGHNTLGHRKLLNTGGVPTRAAIDETGCLGSRNAHLG